VETLRTWVYNYLNYLREKMGRPSTPNTKYFQRTLSDPQRMILLAAGKGNLCRGFENVLDLYSHAHNEGFRPGDDLSILNIGHATTNSPKPSDLVRDDIRESVKE
jgi:hypothetical protein